MGLFSSVKVIDLTRVFSGPFATRHFADQGADVLKIEPPQGDDSRHFPPHVGGWSGYFEVINRNKRSLALDLKTDRDRGTFFALCAGCDVVVENFSGAVKRRLGVDYADVARVNPSVVYASITGVSDAVDRRYYDVIAQAESGLLSLNGESDDMKNATSVVDAFAGMKLAYAVAAALYDRERTGKGCHVTVSMKGAAFDLLEQNLVEASVTGKDPPKVGNMDSAIAPFGVFKTGNGAIAVAVGNDAQWKAFAAFLREADPSFDGAAFATNALRVKNVAALKRAIESAFAARGTDAVAGLLEGMGIPHGKANTMLGVIADAENFREGLLERVRHPVAGEIILPVGGIAFDTHPQEPYRPAPSRGDAHAP